MMLHRVVVCVLVVLLLAHMSWAAPSRIPAQAGIKGGFVVVLGCDAPQLIAELRVSDSYLVQALDTDSAKVNTARARLAAGKYGVVSARVFDGTQLPYVDNLVNLLVQARAFEVSTDEIRRVLAPNGVAVDATGKVILRNPWPQEIDEWTHFLHGPDNNAVAQDTRIDEPRHVQWIAGPKWARHHDRMASMSAAVSAKGRLFYIMDEGATASMVTPAKWSCVARDAFSGVSLWKRSIPDWYPHLWPLKSGPAWLPRRLVAVGDHVYVTLGLRAPVTQLDAGTGKTVRKYTRTEGTGELLVHDGILLVVVDESQRRVEYKPTAKFGMRDAGIERDMAAKNSPWDWTPRRVMAIRTRTAEVLWEKKYPVAPLSLSMNDDQVVFHDGEAIVCLGRSKGEQRWRTRPDAELQGSPRSWYAKSIKNIGKLGKALPASFAPTLVLHKDVVLFSGGDGTLVGLDVKTGTQLWVGECLASGHYTPEDVLVAGGLVWTCDIAHASSSGKIVGLDPRTGEVKRTIQCDAKIHWFHQRCYRSKATERYLLTSRTGIEFIDHETGHWKPNHWVRGSCLYGILPCNGLIYTPPNNCACYIEARMPGFNALAPTRPDVPASVTARLQRGPAFGKGSGIDRAVDDQDDWPVFRHDNERSGCTATRLPVLLKEAWRVNLSKRISQPTVAGDNAVVAVPDEHAVVCLDVDTGKERWRFTADGRIDSPPALSAGLCVFGSADGHVYCLNLQRGELVWRFRAGPADRAVVAFGQPESVWPVSGSVLVREGIVTLVAGRSVFLDGGLRMIRLELRSGNLLSELVMDDRDPENPQRPFQYRLKGLNMPVGLPDILSCDGRHIYMRSQQFDLAGKRTTLAPASVKPGHGGVHLFSPAGFLDETWMHRTYWVYGTGFAQGAGGWFQAGRAVVGGRILSVGAQSVYGYGRKPGYFNWSTPLEYQLFASGKPQSPGDNGAERRKSTKGGGRYLWTRDLPFHVTAMVATRDTLFVAGPPVVVNEAAAYNNVLAANVRAQLASQDEALRGAKGSLLQAVSRENGRTLSELKLDLLPAFDGMAAARGKLFVATTAGTLVCYRGE